MADIFLFTAANQKAQENFQHTIVTGHALSDIAEFISDQGMLDKLKSSYPDGKCFLWGAQDSEDRRKKWNRMQEGDLVLGYRNFSIISAAFLIAKIDSPQLAEKVWGKYPDGPFQLAYFLTKPIQCEVRVKTMPQYFGQEYRGFTRIASENTARILGEYGSLEKFVQRRLVNNGNGGYMKGAPKTENSIQHICKFITGKGFHFEPWQIACYITSLRTKPFVILAGVSGTGKSKLPALVADATGGISRLVPVHPDWTDSAEVIGYKNLQGAFQPGQLMQFIKDSQYPDNKKIQNVCIIDEMNLARVEHYFAEVLSKIEDRRKTAEGYESGPLSGAELDEPWRSLGITANLAIVGTVNMDESTHGLSKKVLDRAFTLELSEINLKIRNAAMPSGDPIVWPLAKWQPRAIRLGELADLNSDESAMIENVINVLTEINGILRQSQLQVGYRTRDEVAMFVIHAQDYKESFKTRSGVSVDPLDLALLMKILPRISGGSMPIRNTVLGLLGWSKNGQKIVAEQDAEPILEQWKFNGQPESFDDANYPRMTARLCLMWDRLKNEGFTSFWL